MLAIMGGIELVVFWWLSKCPKLFYIFATNGARGTGELPTVFWWGNLRERHHLEDLGRNGRKVLKRILKP